MVGRASASAIVDGDNETPYPAPTHTLAEREAAQPDAVFNVDVAEPLVGLTFDDGPDPRYTPQVLDVLDQHAAKATFFLVGVNAAAHPELVAQQLGGGHTLGNHTYDHVELERLDEAHVRSEIDRGAMAIEGAGGPPLRLFRPPKGYTDTAVGVLADARRYRTIFWDVCLERYIGHHGIVGGVRTALDRVRPGSIIVAHDGGHVLAPHHPYLNRSRTVQALPLLLSGLAERGLRPVDVPTLLQHAQSGDPRRH